MIRLDRGLQGYKLPSDRVFQRISPVSYTQNVWRQADRHGSRFHSLDDIRQEIFSGSDLCPTWVTSGGMRYSRREDLVKKSEKLVFSVDGVACLGLVSQAELMIE